MRLRVIERSDQPVVFRDVVGGSPDIFFQPRDNFAARIANHHAVGSGPGISARAAINVRAPRSRFCFRSRFAEKSRTAIRWSSQRHYEAPITEPTPPKD